MYVDMFLADAFKTRGMCMLQIEPREPSFSVYVHTKPSLGDLSKASQNYEKNQYFLVMLPHILVILEGILGSQDYRTQITWNLEDRHSQCFWP